MDGAEKAAAVAAVRTDSVAGVACLMAAMAQHLYKTVVVAGVALPQVLPVHRQETAADRVAGRSVV